MPLKTTGILAALSLFSGIVSAACSTTGGTTPVSAPITAPPMLPAARNDDKEGATYYASHWVDLIDYARRTLDANPLRPLGLPTCHTCTDFITQLDHDKAAGFRYNGGGVHFLSADPADFQQGKSAVINVQFEEGEMQVIDHGGKVVETVPADTIIFNFNLSWTGAAGWRAATIKLGVVPSSAPSPTS